jgi:zinc transport system substrate-binding protein
MKRTTKITLLCAGIVVVGVIAGLFWHGRAGTGNKVHGKLHVAASFYPMAEFARHVGGSKVSVVTLVKPGVEPHDYDPSAKDIATIYKSDVLVYNGAGLEKWEGKLASDLGANNVSAVEASRGISLRTSDGSASAPTDPHVWMDPVIAQKEVANIRDAFIKADPKNRKAYEANAATYTAELQALDVDFQKGLQQCAQHTIVTSHQAFNYLANQYHLDVHAIAGLSPDDEPSPQALAQVADLVRAQHIRYIFFESLVSPKLSNTIAQETGAKAIAFNPLEGLSDSEILSGKNYISVQKDNLQSLRTVLDCQ